MGGTAAVHSSVLDTVKRPVGSETRGQVAQLHAITAEPCDAKERSEAAIGLYGYQRGPGHDGFHVFRRGSELVEPRGQRTDGRAFEQGSERKPATVPTIDFVEDLDCEQR